MFFPNSHHLPTTGDIVTFRHGHTPYTVALHSPDRTLYHLVGIDEPQRVETLAWYPSVGDRVEVLFCPYLRHCQKRFAFHQANWWNSIGDDRNEHQGKMDAAKEAMKWSRGWRAGVLKQVVGGNATVQFSDGDRVLPFDCISVVTIEPEKKEEEKEQNVAENYRADRAA